MLETSTGFEPVTMGDGARGRMTRSVAMHSLAAAFMFISPLQLLVPSAFLNCGIRFGARAAWSTLFGATMLLALLTPMVEGATAVDVLTTIGRFALTIGLPAVVIVPLVQRRVPFGTIVVLAVGISVGSFLLIESTVRAVFAQSPYQETVDNFVKLSNKSIDDAKDLYKGKPAAAETLEPFRRVSAYVGRYLVASILMSVTALMFVLSLVMIPRLPAGRITGATYLFRNFVLPDWLLFGFLLGGLSPVLPQGAFRTIGLNLLVVVVFFYLLQGLAVFRFVLLKVGTRWFGTLVAYTLVIALFPYAGFVLFITGLFDPFFDFRNFNRKEDSDESDFD